MDGQELNFWLLKHTQTESILQSEERRLESVKKEYNSEVNKYNTAKSDFKSVKQKLLNGSQETENPKLNLDKGVDAQKDLKTGKKKISDIELRLSKVEEKVKRHSLLVLQNKKKLEALEERINMLVGKKITRRNFREELEIIDGKIQQMARAKIHINREKDSDISTEALKEDNAADLIESSDKEEFSLSLVREHNNIHNFDVVQNDDLSGRENSHSSHAHSGNHQHNGNHNQPQPEQAVAAQNTDNRQYYQEIENINYLRDDGTDQVNLRYYNKSGNCFEIEVTKQPDNSLSVQIRPQSRMDSLSLKSTKYEILKSLRERGFKLTAINIMDVEHV